MAAYPVRKEITVVGMFRCVFVFGKFRVFFVVLSLAFVLSKNIKSKNACCTQYDDKKTHKERLVRIREIELVHYGTTKVRNLAARLRTIEKKNILLTIRCRSLAVLSRGRNFLTMSKKTFIRMDFTVRKRNLA